MPLRAPTTCRRPGCRGLVRGGVCSVCGPVRTIAASDEQRGTAAQRGYDGRWQRVRLMYLRAHPLCAECGRRGQVTVADMVDHVRPIADGGAVLDEANLQSLCHACHARKTAQDLAGRRATG